MNRRPLLTAIFLSCSAFLLSLQAAEEKPKIKPYPLETCIISGEKLGGMGKPMVFEYKGQEVKLCCKSCLKDFKKDSAKYMKKIAKAEKK